MSQINSLGALNKFSDDVAKSEQFMIDPRVIEEEEGFNVRDTFDPTYWERPEIKAHVRGLADSYKSGAYVPPMVVKVKNGTPYLRAGAHRLRGVMLAISEGADIVKVPVVESRGDEIAETIFIAKENGGQPLSALSLSVIYGRLQGWGYDLKRIAQVFGKTSEHVRQTIKLRDLPVALKRLIADGVVSASYASQLYDEHGDQAAKVIEETVQQQIAQNEASQISKKKDAKIKVTKKNISTGKPLPKKLVSELQSRFVGLAEKFTASTPEADGSVIITLKMQQSELDVLLKLKEMLNGNALQESSPSLDDAQSTTPEEHQEGSE